MSNIFEDSIKAPARILLHNNKILGYRVFTPEGAFDVSVDTWHEKYPLKGSTSGETISFGQMSHSIMNRLDLRKHSDGSLVSSEEQKSGEFATDISDDPEAISRVLTWLSTKVEVDTRF